ncbi:hypothetical protein BH24GEM3_BH24GEM3_02090 [soil metagenome]
MHWTVRTTLLACFLLQGCATVGNTLIPLNSSVRVKDSDFERTVTLLGVEERIGKISDYAFLRSGVDKVSGEAIHQLYVTYKYGGDWRFYGRANGAGGVSLDFVEIERKVQYCSTTCYFSEDFGATLPEELLREYRNRGYQVKFYAQSGDELIVTLSPNQITEQLRALDSYRARTRLGGSESTITPTAASVREVSGAATVLGAAPEPAPAPAPTPTPAPTRPVRGGADRWVTVPGARSYYWHECDVAKKLPQDKLIRFGTEEEAQAAGYQPPTFFPQCKGPEDAR